MKARLLRFASNLRESYWFVPSIMAATAMLLALLMVYFDSHFGSAWMDRLPWLYAARPDGARSLLSSVGGSMIGVAGTTFSVTIAAVVYASGQYGPRLLSNFMADRGNQLTLGTFIATFLYSMIVLRTIRSPGESGGGAEAFVPQLAVGVGLILVLGSVAVLIFFIHHVPRRIHINSVIEEVGERLIREIDNRFPVFVGQPIDDEGEADPRIPADFRATDDVGALERIVAVRSKDTMRQASTTLWCGCSISPAISPTAAAYSSKHGRASTAMKQRLAACAGPSRWVRAGRRCRTCAS